MICKSFFKFQVLISVILLVTGCYNLQWDGRSVNEILSMPAENATPEDIDKLPKKDVLQLFLAASSPEFSEIKGEYEARVVSPNRISDFYSEHMMGPGEWEGKGFFPFEEKKG